ncbi:small metal-binding protein SmbP [Nitrospira moscoviensis]|uniref:Uncharacterized protein n=1 Tax=Nitrospira moscoviensis TaxID=42253 RepID=A0A0K2GDG3_NITMO|nr:small metal-binding protein SmbP [Nitrospira moscoviensis]ALA58991.1 exported protein of unknown function [Nitrospira moscoviensis]
MIQRMKTILPAAVLVVLSGAAFADQPPPGGATMSSRDFKAVIEEALHHAYEADAAGAQGDGRGLKKHARKALEKAKEGQRAGHNEQLNDGVYALGDAIEHAEHDTEDAVEHIKRAIMKLSQSADLQMAPRGGFTRDMKRQSPSGGAPGRIAAYSGGYFDDGFADDDWFYDYYDLQSSERASAGTDPASVGRQSYEAEQLYENARTSRLFDF